MGYLEYQARAERREVGNDASVQTATLRVEGASYLGRAWIGDIAGGVGLSFNHTREGDATQDGSEITGVVRLRLLPRSKFPFEAHVERRDTQVDGDLVGPSYVQTQYGFRQTFLPSATARYILSYTHTDQDNEGNQRGAQPFRSTNDFASVSLSQSFEHHQLDANSDYNATRRDNPSETNLTTLNVLRHRFSSGSTFSVDSMASALTSDLEETNGHTGTRQLQWNSNLFWRPATTKPSFVSGSFLALQVDPLYTAQNAAITTLLASGTASYQYTPALSYRASTSITEDRSAIADNWSTLTRLGATYAPAEIPWRAYAYRYSLGGEVGYRTDDSKGDSESVAATLSHGLSRSRTLWGGIGSANLTQQLTSVYDTMVDQESSLAHTATLDWSQTRGLSSAFLRFLASDTRRIDGNNFAFDLINLQGSGIYQSTRLSAWTGNMTIQWTHSETETGSSPWLLSTSAFVSYRRERVFGVPLLRFTSELRALSDDLATASGSTSNLDRRETVSWSNRLDYVVGRTQLTLRAAIAEVDHNGYVSVHFLARRYFGRLPQ